LTSGRKERVVKQVISILGTAKEIKILKELSRLTKEINRQDISFEEALSYEQCREKMALIKPDVLIFDKHIFSTDKEAFEFIRLIHNSYPDCVQIIIGQIKDSPLIVRDFLKTGVYDYWLKPVDKKMVLDTLNLVCNKFEKKSDDSFLKWGTVLDKILPSLKSSLVYDLIFGNLKNAKEIWEWSKLVGLNSTPNIVMVINIDNFSKLTMDKSEHWKQLLRKELFGVVQAVLDNIPGILLGSISFDSIAVLLTIEQEHEAWMMKKTAINLAEKIKYSVEMETKMTVSIGIGDYYEDARNLHLSYKEALKALAHKFFIGNNQVIHVNDIKPFNYDVRILPYEKETELLNKIRLGEIAEARIILQEVIQEKLEDKNIDPDTLKIQAMEFLVILSRVIKESGVESDKLLSTQFRFAGQLQKIEIIEELKNWMFEVLESYLLIMSENHNLFNLKAVRQAIKYIEENFNQEISLESVANFVCLSPNYFSSIFKKEVGSTFVEYLTELRIKKAKELLNNLENNINQVASKVGYQDSRYFSRVFKTIVGVPPTTYRNKR